MDIKVLIFLDSKDQSIIEIKKLNMPEGSSPEKVYFWLLIDKHTQAVSRLDFISMKKQPEQERFFRQGLLTFNESMGLYSTDKETYTLICKGKEQLTEELKKLIINYLEITSI